MIKIEKKDFFKVSKNSKSKIITLFISGSNLKNDRHLFGMIKKKDDQNVKNKTFLTFQKIHNLK
jgi:hypothetical protein